MDNKVDSLINNMERVASLLSKIESSNEFASLISDYDEVLKTSDAGFNKEQKGKLEEAIKAFDLFIDTSDRIIINMKDRSKVVAQLFFDDNLVKNIYGNEKLIGIKQGILRPNKLVLFEEPKDDRLYELTLALAIEHKIVRKFEDEK